MEDRKRKTRLKAHDEDDGFDWKEALRQMEIQKEVEAKEDLNDSSSIKEKDNTVLSEPRNESGSV